MFLTELHGKPSSTQELCYAIPRIGCGAELVQSGQSTHQLTNRKMFSMKSNIVWTAVSSAVLATISILLAGVNPSLSLAAGLASISNAILSLRD